ncbi:porin [Labrys sp. KNU-23]|uniref:porin n=1 Tax=Labrys sp. KNU-23 TaxID=2789216 RepID=UPI0011EDB59E|nr:porin [Labrys sp. KNU-23]QEN90443.1 porin [Labrys sp. KNU-23]
MTIKSLLLGAAASLTALATAQAADLPMTKGEAVEYVKVCSAFGPGFFYIPGSDTCLKIAGEIRADYRGYNQSGDGLSGNNFVKDGYKQNRDFHSSAFNTEARISFDARTQTEFGLLRSFFQIRGNSHPINWDNKKDTSGNAFSIKYAYIQFGGLTAGYAHSFFGFYDLDFGNTVWGPYYAQSNVVNLLAYTADFGGGFTATLSIEDGRDHRQNAFRSTLQGGQQVPDVVGQIRLKQDWGSVAVQAAAHQYRTAIPRDTNGNVIPVGQPGYYPNNNKWGYAVGGTLLINIPAIDKGHFVIEGQYADGALDYLGIGSSKLKGQDFFFNSNGGFDGGKGWSVTAELGGNFAPQWGANLVGAYIDTTYDKFSNLGDRKVKEYSLTGNVIYTIVKGLTITGEVTYTHQTIDNLSYVPAAGAAAIARDAKSDFWMGGVRIKRTF